MESGSPWWATLVIAVIGIGGTLSGVTLTQRYTGLREEVRWRRERQRDDDTAARARADEQARWLRDQRLAIYTRLLHEFAVFGNAIYKSEDVAQDVWQEGTPLFESRRQMFAILDEAALVADTPLQRVLSIVSGLAEDVGHEPYIHEPDEMLEQEKRSYRRRLWLAGYRLGHQAEDAIREELGLPARREPAREDGYWGDYSAEDAPVTA
ncbi:hypothetical protein ACIODS_25400 [Micromonospora chalcea]|uniref:hypothetical protein n=1 Tax=Micromonospora chalcea TaxID=1874 RepID=UPI0037FAF74A